MSLVRIDDLRIQPREVVADFKEKASMLSQLYSDYVEADPSDGHLRAPGIHASEISKCGRRVVYNILNTEKRSKIKKIWRQRFEVGKYIHLMIQNDFHNMASRSRGLIQFQSEAVIGPRFQEIASELNIHSSCDGIFTFREDPFGPAVLRIGLEIKTESPDQYVGLKAPRPDHIEQAHVYMKCLDLPLFYFMYFNKGNQNNTDSTGPYLIEFNPELWQDIEGRCRKYLADARAFQETASNWSSPPTELEIRTSGLPERVEGIQCEFCPYSHTCQPNYLKKKATSGGSARWQQPRKS